MRWAGVPSAAQRSAILEMAERAARARPNAPGVQLAWANALEGAGDQSSALDRFEAACSLFPGDEMLHSAFAAALTRAGKIEAGLAQVARWGGAPWATKIEFRLLMRAGRFDGLEDRAAALAEADPADPDLLEYRARQWLHRPEALLRACDEALARHPGAMHALYHKAAALVQLGRADEAREIMALERYLRIVPLGANSEFDGEHAFLKQLAAEIGANPTLHADPAGHATRQGLRTATFPLPADRAGNALIRAIKAKVADYSAALSGDHPFPAARPATATFKSWALLFKGLGHQCLHHHPGPWLTGVYYVAAPGGPPCQGALRIGALPHWLDAERPWPVIEVEPTPGTLVLFPSFVPHETLPTGSDETRISVAFDVAAADR
jgi:tetratricopeptide (TPR) repeat protein